MKTFLLTLMAGALAFMGMTSDAAAKTEAFDCDLSLGTGANDWVSDRYVFAFDKETGVAAVTDRIALIFNQGAPAEARVDRETRNGGVVLKWSIKARSASGQNAELRYSAVLDIARGRVSIIANPLGYEGNFNGGGSCSKAQL